MRIPQTLFARTALILALAQVALLIVAVVIFGLFVMKPTAKQASEDAAGLLVLSAQTWAELPPDTREDFAFELQVGHGIYLEEADSDLLEIRQHVPYLEFLQEALSLRMGTEVKIGTHSKQAHWYDVDLPIAGRTLRLSFPRDKFVPEWPQALFWVFLAAGVLTLLASLLLVRHLTRPLASLGDAAVRFGQAGSAQDLPENGPEEIKQLTRSFNAMTVQMNQLMENRTTLLAGISHDLKTPIARLALALEMLPEDADAALQDQMRKDLKDMNQLISRTLELARNMEESAEPKEEVDLTELLDGILAELSDSISQLTWEPTESCVIATNVLALRRVLTNLVENAIRYGGEALEVQCRCNEEGWEVEILDNGPGIAPEHLDRVFQPFHRLDTSRNLAKGSSGLGLAIVQQLCHANHWDISLSNRFSGGLRARLSGETES